MTRRQQGLGAPGAAQRFGPAVVWLVALAAPLVVGVGGGDAMARQADGPDAVARLNAIYTGRDRAVPDERRADKVLLPAVAAMAEPPAFLTTQLTAALLAPADGNWAEAESWALGGAQQEAVEALRKVGAPDGRFAFLQPYGPVPGAPEGLTTDLGDPPIIAAAQFGALEGLSRLGLLAHVEATRLARAGEVRDACDLMLDWFTLGRMMADREMLQEVRWGGERMAEALERLRDIAHEHASALTEQDCKDLIDRLDAKKALVDRVQIPDGEMIAMEQIIARAFVPREGPSAETFGSTMARASASQRPLALFGEAARWNDAAGAHGGTFDTIDRANAVYKDIVFRWGLPTNDPVLKTPTDYQRLDKERFAAVDAVLGELTSLFPLRERVVMEVRGTRMSLAVVAFKARQGIFPPNIRAVKPAYVVELEGDPALDEPFRLNDVPFQYFVPIRDQPRGERELPKPHTIRVALDALPNRVPDEAAIARLDAMATEGNEELVKGLAELITLDVSRARDMDPVLDAVRDATSGLQIVPADGTDGAELARAVEDLGVNLSAVNGRAAARALADLEAKVRADWGGRDRRALLGALTPEAVAAAFVSAWEDEVKKAARSDQGYLTTALDDSGFVLYSIGSNRIPEWARNVGEGGSDILIWPPLVSLLRDAAEESGIEPSELRAGWTTFEPDRSAPRVAAPVETEERRQGGGRPGGIRPR